MANFLTGTTFGTTEQVTNSKLHNIVNNASISSIKATELSNGILSSLASSAGAIPPQNMVFLGSIPTNASLIDVSRFTSVNLFYSTYCSLGTFINGRIGQVFTLIAQQASFPAIIDVGNFKLASNWIPAKQYDNLTLIWNGSVFIEIGRVVT